MLRDGSCASLGAQDLTFRHEGLYDDGPLNFNGDTDSELAKDQLLHINASSGSSAADEADSDGQPGGANSKFRRYGINTNNMDNLVKFWAGANGCQERVAGSQNLVRLPRAKPKAQYVVPSCTV